VTKTKTQQREKMELHVFFGLFIATVIPFSVGLSYLVQGLAYKHTYTGTLTNVHTTKKCVDESCNWKVVEDFQKGNYPSTCQIERLREYSLESRANHVVNKTILGTQRQIWEYWNNADECYDQNIRDYNVQVGITLLAFTGFVIFGSLTLMTIQNFRETAQSAAHAAREELPSPTINRPHLELTHIDIESAGNFGRQIDR
jgi:hypothetical protein